MIRFLPTSKVLISDFATTILLDWFSDTQEA